MPNIDAGMRELDVIPLQYGYGMTIVRCRIVFSPVKSRTGS
jgi:hypothetical protein